MHSWAGSAARSPTSTCLFAAFRLSGRPLSARAADRIGHCYLELSDGCRRRRRVVYGFADRAGGGRRWRGELRDDCARAALGLLRQGAARPGDEHFFAAIPIGSALGFLMGGHFGSPERLGWRHTLYLVGLPGLLTAAAAFFMREPKRGVMDEKSAEAQDKTFGWLEGYRILFTNRGYLFACFGYAAITFALGALVFWAPEWLKSDKGMSAEDANKMLGVCAVIGGTVGTMAGGVIADRLTKKIRGAFFWVCAASSLLAAIPTIVAITSHNKTVYLISIFLGITLVFIGNG